MHQHGSRQGSILLVSLMCLSVLGCLLAAYFSIVQHQVNSVTRSTGRVQALYLAEAGLDAANDLLSQQWERYDDPQIFPLQEIVAVTQGDVEVQIGEFEATVRLLSKRRLRITSIGRSHPLHGSGRHPMTYQCERTAWMDVVRRDRPVFRRGDLQLQAEFFDRAQDTEFLKLYDRLAGPLHSIRLHELLRPASSGVGQIDEPLLGSFTDVDRDGDLDLVVLTPSATSDSSSTSRRSVVGSPETEERLVTGATTADLFGTGTPIPILVEGLVVLPQNALSGLEPGSAVFLNDRLYDGTLLVSWGSS